MNQQQYMELKERVLRIEKRLDDLLEKEEEIVTVQSATPFIPHKQRGRPRKYD